MALGAGDSAPEFELPGIDGLTGEKGTWALSELRGGPAVLVFYPADNSVVCTRQLNSYTHDIGRFAELGARVLALSPQGIDSHVAFRERNGSFAFPLLADEDKAVGRLYGVVGRVGFYRRSAFVVDPEGTIVYAHRAVSGLTFRSTEELVEAIGRS